MRFDKNVFKVCVLETQPFTQYIKEHIMKIYFNLTKTQTYIKVFKQWNFY